MEAPAFPTVALRVPVSITAPREARHGVVDGLGLIGDIAARTALLVSEAVTNSVIHAGLGPADVVIVDARCTDRGVFVEVCDQGDGLASTSPDLRDDGGHGIDLIDQLADRWGAASDGRTCFWFELAG